MSELDAGRRSPRFSKEQERPFSQPFRTFEGVPVAGLEPGSREMAGSELCFVSHARLAERAPVAVGASRGQSVRIFDAANGDVLAKYSIPADEQDVISIDIDDDGGRVAILDLGYRVWLWDWRGGEAPRLVGALPRWEPSKDRTLAIATIRFGPGSERIVVGQPLSGALLLDRDGLVVQRIGTGIDLSGDGPPDALPGFIVDVHQTSWSEDGRRVLFLVDGWPRLLDAMTGEEIPLPMEENLSYVEQIALSPDGAWLATGHLEKEVIMTRIEGGGAAWERIFPLEESPGDEASPLRMKIHGLGFSRDGETLAAVVEGRSRMVLLDAANGRVLGFSGVDTATKHYVGELTRVVSAGFLMTSLPCGFIQRIRMGEPGGLVLHSIEGMGTPPDSGWNGGVFFAGENSYELVDPEDWETRWSTPIQDW